MLQNEESVNSLPSNLTLCIVTYEKDFDLLDRLIQSVSNFWETQCIELLIVLNDLKETEEELINITKNYSDIKIRIVWAGDIIKSDEYDWHTQQTMKLLLSNYVETTWFMLLDSKNYFSSDDKKIKISDFFNPEGKAYASWGLSKTNLYFIKQYEFAYKLWNLDIPNVGETLNEFTPLFFYTELMRELTIELKYRFQSLLPHVCSSHWKGTFFLTEFAIMSAFIKHKQMNKILYDDTEIDSPIMKRLGKIVMSDKDMRRP
jgi:hypothetical protein